MAPHPDTYARMSAEAAPPFRTPTRASRWNHNGDGGPAANIQDPRLLARGREPLIRPLG